MRASEDGELGAAQAALLGKLVVAFPRLAFGFGFCCRLRVFALVASVMCVEVCWVGLCECMPNLIALSVLLFYSTLQAYYAPGLEPPHSFPGFLLTLKPGTVV